MIKKEKEKRNTLHECNMNTLSNLHSALNHTGVYQLVNAHIYPYGKLHPERGKSALSPWACGKFAYIPIQSKQLDLKPGCLPPPIKYQHSNNFLSWTTQWWSSNETHIKILSFNWHQFVAWMLVTCQKSVIQCHARLNTQNTCKYILLWAAMLLSSGNSE